MASASRLRFRPVDFAAHADLCVSFRVDSYEVSYGSAERFGDAQEYLERMVRRSAQWPGSIVHVWAGAEIIGQLELREHPDQSDAGYVNLFYLVSWLYVITDTMVNAVDEVYVQGRRRQVARVVLFMSLFHSIATMLIPAVAIHEAVHLAMVLLKRAAASPSVQLWVPTMVGLSLIPALPIVDEPLHHALKRLFDRLWPEAQAATAREHSARQQHAA